MWALKAEPVDDDIIYVNPDTFEENIFYGHCRRGERYRLPFYVPGSCVKNRANVVYEPDNRCAQNMHWRNTFYVRGKCLKIIEKKLKRGKTVLQECDRALIEPLFQAHLIVIRSYLQELFTVPISKEKLVNSVLYRKVRNKFVQSLVSVTNQKKCFFKLTEDQEQIIKEVIKEEVYAFNNDFISPKQWALIKETAELEMLISACKKIVKSKPDDFKLTFLVDERMLTLRNNLLGLEENNLLPKQNVLVAKAVQEYVSMFETRENLHALSVEPVNVVPKQVQKNNMNTLLYKALTEGYLEASVNGLYTLNEYQNLELPVFAIPVITPKLEENM